MFRGELLIDGYNLLHAAGLAKRSYGPGEFERCRVRLLKLLSSQLSDQECRRTTVVFDAPRQSLGPGPPTYFSDMRILFAGGSGDADETIEALIRRNSAPKRLHVVSSDHRLQRAARRRRAKFYDSDDFLAKILRRLSRRERAARAEPREKHEGLTSASEVEAWLEAFAARDAEEASDTVIPDDNPHGADSPEAADRSEAAGFDPSAKTKLPPDEVTFWENRIAELRSDADRNV